MEAKECVLLSGFSDEASSRKCFREQLAVISALGMRYLALRFLDVGEGCKNAMALTPGEVQRAQQWLAEFDVKVSSLASPLGKVKLLDCDDGTANRFVPFDEYLKSDVTHACTLAHAFDVRLVRGFTFYPPRGDRPEDHLDHAVDQLGRMADYFRAEGLTFGLEVEANLVGSNGQILHQIYQALSHPSVVLIFDSANLLMQGYEVQREYEWMRDALGWLHIKDYRSPHPPLRGAYVDEDRASGFVPAGSGDGSYLEILQDVRDRLSERSAAMRARGAPGFFLELEPHLRGGGQFGGYSGPDGFGIALRALCRLLDQVGLSYQLRSDPPVR